MRKGSNQQNCGSNSDVTSQWLSGWDWTSNRPKVYLQSLTVNTTRHLLRICLCRNLSLFGHTIRDGGCDLGDVCYSGEVNGKRRLGRHKTPYRVYSSSITRWVAESMEQISRDRTGRRRSVRCATRAADHHSWWDREEKEHSLIFMSSLIRLIPYAIHCHLNARSKKYLIT